MLLGLAMSRGVKMPIPVITTKPIYVPLLTEFALEWKFVPNETADPITPPRLKITQKIPMNRPFCASVLDGQDMTDMYGGIKEQTYG
jgi:hypothetical protein